MRYFTGIDVSLGSVSICVVDAAGEVLHEAKVAAKGPFHRLDYLATGCSLAWLQATICEEYTQMPKATVRSSPERPHWTLLALEPARACFELVTGLMSSTDDLPRGDGHPVVVFPGLGGASLSTRPLRQLCEQLGYAAYDWGRGQNVGPDGDPRHWFDELTRHVRSLTRSHRQPVSLIGWSLGGIYAREVAKRLGKAARRVITLGAPFAGTPDETNAVWLYRLLNGEQPPAEPGLVQSVARPPRVPTTSIYTRSDGVVAWQACVQVGRDSHVENVEVTGSHCGLGWNREVLEIVARKLSVDG